MRKTISLLCLVVFLLSACTQIPEPTIVEVPYEVIVEVPVEVIVEVEVPPAKNFSAEYRCDWHMDVNRLICYTDGSFHYYVTTKFGGHYQGSDLYFKNSKEWYDWYVQNQGRFTGVWSKV